MVLSHSVEISLGRMLKLVLLFSASAYACFVIFQTPYSSGVREFPDQNTLAFSSSDNVSLDRILKEASMNDRTVILAPLNGAWAAPNSVLDLFLESFEIGENITRLLNHLVIVALDQKAYTHCMSLQHIHCFPLTIQGLDPTKGASFLSPQYIKMVWGKINFLRSVLEMGYNFLFTDVDIMWFRDPFLHIDRDTEFQVASDYFYGNSSDLANRPNTGLMYVKSTVRTIKFYKVWYAARTMYPGFHTQAVFNQIKRSPLINKIGLNIRFLDTAYYGGFCQPSKNLSLVCTMHATCCYKLNDKLADLPVILNDWKKFMSLPENVKRLGVSSWTYPKTCRPKTFYY